MAGSMRTFFTDGRADRRAWVYTRIFYETGVKKLDPPWTGETGEANFKILRNFSRMTQKVGNFF